MADHPPDALARSEVFRALDAEMGGVMYGDEKDEGTM
jgi:hypothetical protein